MSSCLKIAVRLCVCLLVCLVVSCTARPMTSSSSSMQHDDVTRGIADDGIRSHLRRGTRKRHAEIRLTHEIARKLESIKRVMKLAGMMKEVHPANDVRTFTVEPTPAPDNDIKQALLASMQGESIIGGLKVNVVNNAPQNLLSSSRQLRRYMNEVRNAVTLARTCIDLQNFMLKNNIRLKVQCNSIPAASQYFGQLRTSGTQPRVNPITQ